MGIRFRCHHCEHELNLKEFQAGRRARCPACSGRFRVPTVSADFSVPLDDDEAAMAGSNLAQQHRTATTSNTSPFNLRPSSSDPDVAPGRNAGQGSLPPIAEDNLPEVIKDAPQAVWYVRPPIGGQYGPAEGRIFFSWLTDHRVSADCLVWRDGWPQWQLAGDVFPETFGDNWRVAHAAPDDGIPLSDDTIENLVPDTGSSVAETPSTVDSPLSKVGINRRKKKQSAYGILIGILFLLAMVLICLLVVVLWK